MTTIAFGKQSMRQSRSVCARCSTSLSKTTIRGIRATHLTREVEKDLEWKERAREIKAGKRKSMLSILEERGYVKQIAGGRDELDNVMNQKRIGVYVGVDPTAPSLHVGHLLPFMALFWMYIHGYPVTLLIGGATSQVGDPTGRNSPRNRLKSDVHFANVTSMQMQLKSLCVKVEERARYQGYNWDLTWKRAIRNNHDWFRTTSVTQFLRDIGGAFRIGEMLTRDTVKSRMDDGQGMSFAEFTYPLMQGWDWWQMYNQVGTQMQIGGSDQFGNIVAGIDAVNHIRKNHVHVVNRTDPKDPLMRPFGLTVPLLTTAAGEKFGKSAGNAIWLDPELTSPFDLYQFMVRTADADVERYLKLFTFIPLEGIVEVMKEHVLDESKRVAQHRLAFEFSALIHGIKVAQETQAEHRQMFGKSGKNVTLGEILNTKPNGSETPAQLSNGKDGKKDFITPSLNTFAKPVTANNMPAPAKRYKLPRSLVENYNFAKILHAAGFTASRSEAHRLVKAGGGYVGRAMDSGDELRWYYLRDSLKPQEFLVENNVLMLRVGKWNVRICEVMDDEEFKAQGLTCPGWDWEEHEIIMNQKQKGNNQNSSTAKRPW